MAEKKSPDLVAYIGAIGALIAALIAAIGLIPVSCESYQSGKAAEVACNAATDKGYFWRVQSKLEHYSVNGVQPAGNLPVCDSSHLGSKAMTARFPIQDIYFREVNERYTNSAQAMTDPECKYIGRNGQGGANPEPRHPPADMCGIYQVICAKQPIYHTPSTGP